MQRVLDADDLQQWKDNTVTRDVLTALRTLASETESAVVQDFLSQETTEHSERLLVRRTELETLKFLIQAIEEMDLDRPCKLFRPHAKRSLRTRAVLFRKCIKW